MSGTPNTRTLVIVGAVVAALLAAVLVVLVVILSTMNAQSEQDAYEACMARHGFNLDEQPNVAPDDLDRWIDSIAEASVLCDR